MNEIEIKVDGKPDTANCVPHFTPVGIFPDGRAGGAFGGSLAYARRKARQMQAEKTRRGNLKYDRVYIRQTWASGAAV